MKMGVRVLVLAIILLAVVAGGVVVSAESSEFVMEFNANSPDGGFGSDVQTSQAFDLVLVIYRSDPWDDPVSISLWDIPEDWELIQTQGNGTWHRDLDAVVWEGNFPSDGGPIELVVKATKLPAQTCQEFGAELAGGSFTPVTSTVRVCNPLFEVLLPFVGK